MTFILTVTPGGRFASELGEHEPPAPWHARIVGACTARWHMAGPLEDGPDSYHQHLCDLSISSAAKVDALIYYTIDRIAFLSRPVEFEYSGEHVSMERIRDLVGEETACERVGGSVTPFVESFRGIESRWRPGGALPSLLLTISTGLRLSLKGGRRV